MCNENMPRQERRLVGTSTGNMEGPSSYILSFPRCLLECEVRISKSIMLGEKGGFPPSKVTESKINKHSVYIHPSLPFQEDGNPMITDTQHRYVLKSPSVHTLLRLGHRGKYSR